MAAASVLYNGSSSDTAAIITAMGTNAADTMLVIPNGNTQGVLIMLQGAP